MRICTREEEEEEEEIISTTTIIVTRYDNSTTNAGDVMTTVREATSGSGKTTSIAIIVTTTEAVPQSAIIIIIIIIMSIIKRSEGAEQKRDEATLRLHDFVDPLLQGASAVEDMRRRVVSARLLVLLKINTSVSACEETHFATHKYELPQGLPEKL
ncbi:hypothetical protein AK812_SmicGene6425 [Symbiodinium microadriaticum]|uniref:Uncharacterized protein n=1 Tax=Symbiodinium microadriaticum TaxID=2951 RepID=A0A1Q9ERC2_SYMMI|nr:hypothetical protein AK812_SmicGene6425 [Symbiodinium microadriaticum]